MAGHAYERNRGGAVPDAAALVLAGLGFVQQPPKSQSPGQSSCLDPERRLHDVSKLQAAHATSAAARLRSADARRWRMAVGQRRLLLRRLVRPLQGQRLHMAMHVTCGTTSESWGHPGQRRSRAALAEFTPGNAEYLRLVRTIDHVIVAPNLTGKRRRQGPQANIS